jgi:2,5-dihydroxypyridine 5,6-dioxygenase
MNSYDFVNICREELRLCAVHEGESIAILSDDSPGELVGHAAAFMQAAKELGALPFHVRVPSMRGKAGDSAAATWNVGTTAVTGHRPVIEVLKSADMVIDLIFMLFSEEQLEIQAAGTRILLAVEPPDVLARLLPDPSIRERVDIGGEMLRAAKSLRVTHPNGTDLLYKLGKYPTITQYGYVDEPGGWDHWPSGFLFTGAYDDGVDGKIVLDPGTIIYPFKTHTRSPITLHVEKGYITDLTGDLDAGLMKDYMDQFNDPDGYAISHIGWGLNEKARWSGPVMDTRGVGQEGRSFYGNILFATGPNQELGGSNNSPCHLDIPLHGYTLELDDTLVVKDGDIAVPSLQARRG